MSTRWTRTSSAIPRSTCPARSRRLRPSRCTSTIAWSGPEQLPPGAFDLNRLPTTTGPNDARLVIRDAFGGTRELAASYYLTTSVLAKGLQQYQYAVGVERTNFGIDNFNYGTFPFVGRHRLDSQTRLTVGGRVEARSDLVSAGPSVTAVRPSARSKPPRPRAVQMASGDPRSPAPYAYVGRRMSLGIAARAMTERYATSSLHPADDRPRTDANGYVSCSGRTANEHHASSVGTPPPMQPAQAREQHHHVDAAQWPRPTSS